MNADTFQAAAGALSPLALYTTAAEDHFCCLALDDAGAELEEMELFAALFRPSDAIEVWWIDLDAAGEEVGVADNQEKYYEARVLALLLTAEIIRRGEWEEFQ